MQRPVQQQPMVAEIISEFFLVFRYIIGIMVFCVLLSGTLMVISTSLAGML